MNKQTYKQLLRIERLMKKNPFAVKIAIASAFTARITTSGNIETMSIITNRNLTEEEKSYSLANMWIEKIDTLVNGWCNIFTGGQYNGSLRNELIKLLLNTLNKVAEKKIYKSLTTDSSNIKFSIILDGENIEAKKR